MRMNFLLFILGKTLLTYNTDNSGIFNDIFGRCEDFFDNRWGKPDCRGSGDRQNQLPENGNGNSGWMGTRALGWVNLCEQTRVNLAERYSPRHDHNRNAKYKHQKWPVESPM